MEYIKLSYHHLNFEDRTALMLESRKEGFSARKFAELIKRHPSTIYRELKRNSINDVQFKTLRDFILKNDGFRKVKSRIHEINRNILVKPADDMQERDAMGLE